MAHRPAYIRDASRHRRPAAVAGRGTPERTSGPRGDALLARLPVSGIVLLCALGGVALAPIAPRAGVALLLLALATALAAVIVSGGRFAMRALRHESEQAGSTESRA